MDTKVEFSFFFFTSVRHQTSRDLHAKLFRCQYVRPTELHFLSVIWLLVPFLSVEW